MGGATWGWGPMRVGPLGGGRVHTVCHFYATVTIDVRVNEAGWARKKVLDKEPKISILPL